MLLIHMISIMSSEASIQHQLGTKVHSKQKGAVLGRGHLHGNSVAKGKSGLCLQLSAAPTALTFLVAAGSQGLDWDMKRLDVWFLAGSAFRENPARRSCTWPRADPHFSHAASMHSSCGEKSLPRRS